MIIRTITEEHYEDSLDLSSFAFQMPLTEEERATRRSQFRPEEKWGAFEGDKLLAQLTLLPLNVYINGKAFAMGGLAGVSTWPEYRRQGLVSQLLCHSLETMRQAGQTISMLHPFEFSFYRKFGWELYTEYRKYTIPTALMPRRQQTSGTIERLAAADADRLAAVYEPYAARYNGTLSRTEEWWTNRIFVRKKGQAALYIAENGQAQGYVLYDVKDMKMTVNELVYWNEEARRALWTFLSNHDSMVKEVVVWAPSDDDLPYLLDNPRIQQEVIPYFMARIVDVEAFINQYAFTSTGCAHEWIIQLTDPHAPWNEGSFVIRVDADGRAQASRLSTGHPQTMQENGMQCDIPTLTAMLLGYKRPTRLNQVGKLTGAAAEIQKLEQIIPISQTFLYDFF
ncbi:GNAT family N-acetyltransferase [Paenibacillus sp. MMS18-CY102]|uniref:GNAT family N-acetyltransferase n=1 Tax=Paenibacillus sp. MMS18-CY102 TaxID=2682849 RepID=UPI00136665DB|nr:GNAT family N-acetyltransferase [Paenibacillus sp. MMS18-CY102]MWC28350.1 GNAT family N-acetyltransferase [Paenibacillus sp. MMS18-CY102]